MKTTLIAATLNEVEAVQVVLPKIDRTHVDEVIIVDAGSTDGTVEYCRANGFTVLMQNGIGYGRGIRQALQIATGEMIIEFPPDGNSLTERIPDLVAEIEKGYDFVIVSRYKDGAKSYDDDIITAFGNRMFTLIINILFGTRYTDTLVGFRAYRRSVFDKLGMDADGLSWPAQSSIRFGRKGFRVGEIPGDEPHRIGGERKMKIFRTGLEIVFLILREYRKAGKGDC